MAASDGRLLGFASGAFGAVVAGAVTHPIDLVKVRGTTRNNGMGDDGGNGSDTNEKTKTDGNTKAPRNRTKREPNTDPKWNERFDARGNRRFVPTGEDATADRTNTGDRRTGRHYVSQAPCFKAPKHATDRIESRNERRDWCALQRTHSFDGKASLVHGDTLWCIRYRQGILEQHQG